MFRRIASCRIVLIAYIGLASIPAVAADFADRRAQRFHPALAVEPPIYLGHFAGGRTFPIPDARKPYVVAWREQYARFHPMARANPGSAA